MNLNKALVSIIIPVYNAEVFLSECMESVLGQSYKNIEVILINDGSKDKSGEMCDNYALIDNRVSVVHQENKGVSSARNAGIDIAQGKYISFIDSDDAIHADFIKILHADMVKYDSNITTTAKDVAVSKESVLSGPVQDNPVSVLSSEETFKELYRGSLEGTRNGVQMFDLNMLNLNNIRYDEQMAVGEDFNFFARSILVSNKVVVDRRRMYFYRSNPSSVMLQNFNRKHFDAIKNVEGIGRTVEGRIPGLKQAIDIMVFSDAVYYGSKALPVKEKWPDEYREITGYIKKYRNEVLTNKSAKKNTRIKALIMCIFGVNTGLMITGRLIKW